MRRGLAGAMEIWWFEPNGGETFRFSVLSSTIVPDPGVIGVCLTRVGASEDHGCGDGADGRVYC